MGSGVIYNEYEKRKKFEDYDMKADAELGTFKIRRYHFDNETFVHPLHSVRFDPDRPYEIPIEALMADKILSVSKSEKSSAERQRSSRRPSPHYSPRTMPVAQRERSTSSVKGTRSFRRSTTSSSVRKPRSWELIPPSEGWMCDACASWRAHVSRGSSRHTSVLSIQEAETTRYMWEEDVIRGYLRKKKPIKGEAPRYTWGSHVIRGQA
ncbi:hypothetical protein PIB30_052857 [Stylosanthes scabra]|uniref:Uncharacterized protein n=1 Tax=Stylosanthes scabra TaxID=79078 RepID=A0ABU6UH18_9FABA|nr:hypothetical protein [Stylosanthes scabra]